jgi:hypothetical protein
MGLNRCLRIFFFHLSTCMLLLCCGLCFQFACQKSFKPVNWCLFYFGLFWENAFCVPGFCCSFGEICWACFGLGVRGRILSLYLGLLMLGSSRNVSMLDMCQVLKQALY